MPRLSAKNRRAFMSQGWPARCTAIIARVRLVIRRSTSSGSIVIVCRINIREHRNAVLPKDRKNGAEIRDRRDNEFIAGFRIERGNGEMHCCTTGRTRDRVRSPQFLREGRFETPHHGSAIASETSRAQRFQQQSFFRFTKGPAIAVKKIRQRKRHGSGAAMKCEKFRCSGHRIKEEFSAARRPIGRLPTQSVPQRAHPLR